MVPGRCGTVAACVFAVGGRFMRRPGSSPACRQSPWTGLRGVVARADVPWLQLVEQFRVADRQALQARLDEVVAGGGEGLMLHRDDALYLTGRSDALLKLKPLFDAEARVVGHLPGKGRLSGMLGALQVETPAGLRFELGTGLSDAERRNPPPVGTLVTYQYRAVTPDGVPRFASYQRRREGF